MRNNGEIGSIFGLVVVNVVVKIVLRVELRRKNL
jgi:hypothetical protein